MIRSELVQKLCSDFPGLTQREVEGVVGAIFDSPYQFRDRFSGADDFYKYKDDIEPDPVRGLAMRPLDQ